MSDPHAGQGVPEYQITVLGMLDVKWADWFDGMAVIPLEGGQTMLAGPVVDQAALHGMLAKIRDLGLTLVQVQFVEKKDED